MQVVQLAFTLFLAWPGHTFTILDTTIAGASSWRCNGHCRRRSGLTKSHAHHMAPYEPHVVLAASQKLKVRLRRTRRFVVRSSQTSCTLAQPCFDPAQVYLRRAFVLRSPRPLGMHAHLSPQCRQKMLLLPRYIHDSTRKDAHMGLQRVLLPAGVREPKISAHAVIQADGERTKAIPSQSSSGFHCKHPTHLVGSLYENSICF